MTSNDDKCLDYAERVADEVAREVAENSERIVKLEHAAKIVANEINSYSDRMRSILLQGFIRTLCKNLALGVIDMIACLEIVKLELFTLAERTSHIGDMILLNKLKQIEDLK